MRNDFLIFFFCIGAILFATIHLLQSNTQKIKDPNLNDDEISQFVIKAPLLRKGVSKTTIKEEIGQEMKETLERCVGLLKTIGQIQIEFANLQKQLFEKIQRLVDNQKPFGKASRIQLKNTLGVLQNINTKLQDQEQAMLQVKQQINHDYCLKRF